MNTTCGASKFQFVQQSCGATSLQTSPLCKLCVGCKRCSAADLQNKPSAHAVNVKGAVLLSRRVPTNHMMYGGWLPESTSHPFRSSDQVWSGMAIRG